MSETEDTAAKKPDRPPKSGRRKKHGAHFLALLIGVPLALLLLAFILVLDRDITAPSWITRELEDRAAEVLAGGSLNVGDVTVTIGRDLHPRVKLQGTTLRDASGVAIAQIPFIEGLFSPRGVIFRREALMQDLRITGAQINLRRATDGSVALSFQTGGADVEEARNLLELLDQSDRVFEQPLLVALEKIRADGLVINYQDGRAGRSWIVDGGQLTLDVRDATTRLTGQFDVLTGGTGITTLAMHYESPHDSQAAAFSLDLKNARAEDIAAQSPALSWLGDVDAPISAELRSARRSDGSLAPLSARLELGAGALQPNAATNPITFDAASAELSFDPGTNTIAFQRVAVRGDLGQVEASGQAFLNDLDDGLPKTLTGQFRFADTILNPPDLYDAPLAIPAAQVDMQLHLNPFRLDIGQIYAEMPGFAVRSHGAVEATDAGWDGILKIHVRRMDFAALLDIWPQSVVRAPRDWFVNAVDAGRLSDLQVSIRKPNEKPLQVAGSFGFEDLSLSFLGSMPPIEGGRGTATFTQDIFALAVNTGTVTAPEGGTVDISGSTMTMPDLSLDPRPAEYDLTITGPITAALSLLDQPPLSFMTRAKLPVDVAAGTTTVRLSLAHPFKNGMRGDEVRFAGLAELRDVRSDDLIPGRSLQADALMLTIDRDRMEIAGSAIVDSVPLDGTFVQSFGANGQREVQATVSLNAARLARFGVDLPPGSVSGEGPATLDLQIPRAAAPRYTVTSNLRGLQIAVPAVGWSKPPSVTGALRVEGRLGDSPQVNLLEVAGGGLDVRGDVTFNAQGGLDRARLSQVRIGDWLNAPITLRGRGAGRPFAVEISGGTVDLRRARFGAGGGGASGPISIALDRLQVTQGIALNRFVGEFTSAGGFAGSFSAWINNVGQIRGTVAPRNGRSAVRIVSDDAGGVALATGLMKNAVGGSLDLTLLPTGGGGTFDGRLAIRSLRIRDVPAIAALLDAISVVGLLQQLDGQGLAFDAVDAAFRLTPQQVILTESSAVGPGLGISLDGIYTLASKQMDFQGVISPFYLINSIGSFLTRRGEGLIGFNFTIAGTSDEPSVGVNPLSAFTPGMFREIFRRDPPVVSQ